MSRFEDIIKPFITHQAGVLSGTLDDAMATALAQARDDSRRYPHEKFPHLLPMLLRCAVRMDLEKRYLPPGWELAGNPKLMGQLLLSNDEYAIDLRLLKERRRSMGVPHAGRNPERQKAWSGDIALPGTFPAPAQPTRTTVLWVWDLLDLPDAEDNEALAFTQRLVHTIAPGSYGRRVPCDLSLDLRHGGGIFDNLEFKGGDDETDLFHVELDETIEDED